MKCVVQHVLYVPELQFSVISVEILGRRGLLTTFPEHGASIPRDGNLYTRGHVLGAPYTLDTNQQKTKTKIFYVAVISTWHESLGQLNPKRII